MRSGSEPVALSSGTGPFQRVVDVRSNSTWTHAPSDQGMSIPPAGWDRPRDGDQSAPEDPPGGRGSEAGEQECIPSRRGSTSPHPLHQNHPRAATGPLWAQGSLDLRIHRSA